MELSSSAAASLVSRACAASACAPGGCLGRVDAAEVGQRERETWGRPKIVDLEKNSVQTREREFQGELFLISQRLLASAFNGRPDPIRHPGNWWLGVSNLAV